MINLIGVWIKRCCGLKKKRVVVLPLLGRTAYTLVTSTSFKHLNHHLQTTHHTNTLHIHPDITLRLRSSRLSVFQLSVLLHLQ